MGFLSDVFGGAEDLIGGAVHGLGDLVGGLGHGVESLGRGALNFVQSNPALALAGAYFGAPYLGALGGAGAATAEELAGAGLGFGGGLGEGAAALGNGAFLGEGVASGVGGWDAASALSGLSSGQLGSALSYITQDPGALLSAFSRSLPSLSGVSGVGTGARASGLGSLFDVGQGLYALNTARQLRRQMDPFAKYRGAYGQRLEQLYQNPNSITSLPGYQAGLEAIRRQAAAGGYAGSGNELAALAQYGGQFYTNEANRLAGLAGAGQTPGAGLVPGAQLAGRGIGLIGGGLRGLIPGG